MVGTLVRGYSCATSWSDLDLTFDLGVVTLTHKILSGLYLGNRRVEEVDYLVGTLVRGCRCVLSWCHLNLTFDLVLVTLTYKILLHLWVSLLMQIKHC